MSFSSKQSVPASTALNLRIRAGLEGDEEPRGAGRAQLSFWASCHQCSSRLHFCYSSRPGEHVVLNQVSSLTRRFAGVPTHGPILAGGRTDRGYLALSTNELIKGTCYLRGKQTKSPSLGLYFHLHTPPEKQGGFCSRACSPSRTVFCDINRKPFFPTPPRLEIFFFRLLFPALELTLSPLLSGKQTAHLLKGSYLSPFL